MKFLFNLPKRQMSKLIFAILERRAIFPFLYFILILTLMKWHETPCLIKFPFLKTKNFKLGGYVSLLALNGLFTLIHEHNLDYPQFYIKLYALFDSNLWHSKYKSRFFRLAELFLSSTYVLFLLKLIIFLDMFQLILLLLFLKKWLDYV